MKHNEMTISEFMAWKSGDFEEYKKLITRKHWLESHIRGASDRQLDYEDAMDICKDYPADLAKWKAKHERETVKLEKYEKEYEDISRQIIQFMKRDGKGEGDNHV